MERESALVVDIFALVFEGLRQCDLLIAEVSHPSHGVGGELMQAFFQELPTHLSEDP